MKNYKPGLRRQSKPIKSICFISCNIASSKASESSFADTFASVARKRFPNLEHIFASPNIIVLFKSQAEPDKLSIQTTFIVPSGDKTETFSRIVPERFFSHDFPEGYYSGKSNPLDQITIKTKGYYREIWHSDGIKSFISRHNLSTQHFRKLRTDFVQSEPAVDEARASTMIVPEMKTPLFKS